MACELLVELSDLVRGAYLMPAFNRFDLIAEIIEGIKSFSVVEHPTKPGTRMRGG